MSAIFNDAGKPDLADGTAITATNTGVSGNTNLALTGTAPVKRIDPTNPKPPGDTAWYEIPNVASGVTSMVKLTPSGYVAATGGALGAWMMFSQNPLANTQIVRWGNSGANYVGLTTAGKLFIMAGSTTRYTTTASIPFNTPLWICHATDSKASNGTARFGWWDIRGNLVETFSGSTYITSAITNATSSIGKVSASNVAGVISIAALRCNTDGAILIPPVIPEGNFGWGMAA